MRILAGVILFGLEIIGSAQDFENKVLCTESEQYILTHALVAAGPVPTAFDPNGVYPYVSYSETANRMGKG